MLPEISLINGNICDFESKYGISFARETGTINNFNGLVSFHLLSNEWVKKTVGVNKRIVSFIAGIDVNENVGGFGVIVFENNDANFINYEIWDLNSNILSQGNISVNGPKYGGGPTPESLGIVNSTQHNVVISKDTTNNTIRIKGTNDISVLWGLINIDLCDFDVTVDLTTLKPI